jgi:hypothetical protein
MVQCLSGELDIALQTLTQVTAAISASGGLYVRECVSIGPLHEKTSASDSFSAALGLSCCT